MTEIVFRARAHTERPDRVSLPFSAETTIGSLRPDVAAGLKLPPDRASHLIFLLSGQILNDETKIGSLAEQAGGIDVYLRPVYLPPPVIQLRSQGHESE
jgi:hypothetical protein